MSERQYDEPGSRTRQAWLRSALGMVAVTVLIERGLALRGSPLVLGLAALAPAAAFVTVAVRRSLALGPQHSAGIEPGHRRWSPRAAVVLLAIGGGGVGARAAPDGISPGMRGGLPWHHVTTKATERRMIAGIAIPVSLEFILILVLNFVSQVIVGVLGATAIAAVGFANSLVFILVVTFGAMGVSVSILVARAFGGQRRSEMSHTVTAALVIAGVLTLLGMLVPAACAEPAAHGGRAPRPVSRPPVPSTCD